MENETQNTPQTPEKAKTPKMIKINAKTAVIIGAVIAVFVVLFLAKGLFVAASVDGSPISRLSVVQELEKRGGKSTLDALITEKLIRNEAKKQNVIVTDAELAEEMKKIEAQVAAQGGTLAEALAEQGMTESSLKEQVRVQQLMQKLLADSIVVSDEEVQKYITDNKIVIPKGEETKTKEQITGQLKDQKLQQEAQVFITNLRNDAKIKYYVNY